MNRVTVVGAGASGIIAAIAAAQNGAEVFLYERNDIVGKKLLSTGNGKCNLTNAGLIDASVDDLKKYYHCRDIDFVDSIIKRFSVNETLDFFMDMGAATCKKNELFYPLSEQASGIRECLERGIRNNNIKLFTNIKVTGILQDGNGYILNLGLEDGTMERQHTDCVILACGSRAMPISGSDGFGYKLCKKLGLNIIKVAPALCPVEIEDKKFAEYAFGARKRGAVKLFIDDELVSSENGEIQFTKAGVSGIVVFQTSAFASRALLDNRGVTIELDLFEEYDEAELIELISKISDNKSLTALEVLSGILNDRLSKAILFYLKIPFDKYFNSLNDDVKKRIYHTLKSIRLKVSSVSGYDNAQTCIGGVSVDMLDRNCMAKSLPGLFVCGELMDVDGICGGFNLQFAWSSGYVAGLSAARYI